MRYRLDLVLKPVEGALVLTAGATQQFTIEVPGATGYRWTVDGQVRD